MKYSESHEWVKIEGKNATVGVTHHAQKELGDIVYVELPKVGKDVKAGKEAAVLESTKAAADVYSPVSGKITAVNELLNQSPELINQSAESEGWIFKLELSNPAEEKNLLEKAAYETLVKSHT